MVPPMLARKGVGVGGDLVDDRLDDLVGGGLQRGPKCGDRRARVRGPVRWPSGLHGSRFVPCEQLSRPISRPAVRTLRLEAQHSWSHDAVQPSAAGSWKAPGDRSRTPLLPADYLDLVSPLRAGADLRGRDRGGAPRDRDAVTLVIQPGRGWRGHTARPVRPDRCRRRRRPPVARLLADLRADPPDGRITITVKAIPDGKVSNHLVRARQPRHARPARPGRPATSSCRRPRRPRCCSSPPAAASPR